MRFDYVSRLGPPGTAFARAKPGEGQRKGSRKRMSKNNGYVQAGRGGSLTPAQRLFAGARN